MFIAVRDIRFAWGRFALMGSVVALITMLIVLLSGLTAGLASQSTSAVRDLPTDRIVFGSSGEADPEESFEDSVVDAPQRDEWAAAPGVAAAHLVGVTQARADIAVGTTGVTVFGAPPDSGLAPERVADGEVVVPEGFAEEEGIVPGDTMTVSGRELTVSAVAGDAYYSHMPALWTTLDTWRGLDPGHTPDAEPGDEATVLAVEVDGDLDVAAADLAADTLSVDVADSLSAIGAFSSENGSLRMMLGFLYAISALVTGAFLTVWTIQRSGDIAILKALGASTRYLLRDALTQAFLVLTGGAVLGGALGVAVGAAAATMVPFESTLATTLFPVAGMVALGMAGAALAVRRVTSVDPLTALGGVR
ncbi:ABC transporter permease [Spiractinospora alimapuensis]|uniref:FtsX-like permease family protein n=1 Tax=Spiractinospora alimapuensis TaxID=2820884 RepID=UPI001F1B3867|nr:ABC transporter permease [Spiractinospora alimapuensis]QVQ52670.1 ABC transporter permease [Spiractinospora alimapuensis]